MGINTLSSNFNITAPKNNLSGLGGFAFKGSSFGGAKTPEKNTNFLSAQTSGLMGETSFMRAEGGRPDRMVGEKFNTYA